MSQQQIYRFDEFQVDPDAWMLSHRGQEVHLEPVVLKLLIYLISHRGRLVTRHELMDTVWGDTVISESALSKAVARLRHALGDDSASPSYLETVHSQGYRFIAEVDESDHPEHSATAAGKRGYYAVAALVAIAIAVVLWTQLPWREEQPGDKIRSLAVLPLSNLTGDAEQDYYVDGLQDILITELSRIPGLRVTSRQSTRRYRASDLTMTEIAAELGVDALVEGSLLRTGDSIEVSVQLIHGKSDEHLWAGRHTRETSYVFELISEIADAIGAELGATAASGGRISPIDPRAIDEYALAIMYFDRFTREGISTGIEHFERAVEIEPDFALAWGQLSAAYAMQGMIGFVPPKKSKERFLVASLRAIEADDQVALGHAGVGHARLYSWDFNQACKSFAEALRLNPSEPYAIHGDSDCLMLAGRFDESVARARELLTISPFSTMHSLPLPGHLYMARRFDEAIEAATAMQARVPQYSTHWLLARYHWHQGRLDEAVEEERLELEWRGDSVLLAALDDGLEAGGPAGAMRAEAEALVARANEAYVDPSDIAEFFARAGSVDEALHWLGKAVENGSYEETWMALWPHWDVLRDDPRFDELLVRVYGQNIPPAR